MTTTLKPVGKLKAELDGAPFEAELDGTLAWRCSSPHLQLWLNSRMVPEAYAGTVYTIGRKLLIRTAETLGGEYEFYPIPEEHKATKPKEEQPPKKKVVADK